MDEFECVKCGGVNTDKAAACYGCGWPLTPDAWKASRRPLRRISLDTNCVNAKQAHSDLNQLEQWAREGKIVLERSGTFLAELKGQLRIEKAALIPQHPTVWALGVAGQSELGVTTMLGGPDVHDEVRSVMFPTTAMLNSNQHADIDHLRGHVRTGGDAFVTLDEDDFIRHGKRMELQRRGIWIFTPPEITQFLKELYGWNA